MMLHPRRQIVVRATIDIDQAISDAGNKHDLTVVELVTILTEIAHRYAMYALRYERHPDGKKKANEA